MRTGGALRAGCVVAAAVMLGGCGVDGPAPGAAEGGATAANVSVDAAGCVSFNSDRVPLDALISDVEAGYAASGRPAGGDIAELAAQVDQAARGRLSKYVDPMPDGAARDFSRGLCESDAYSRDLDWLRGRGEPAAAVEDTAKLYAQMRQHPAMAIMTLGISTCTAAEMFGDRLDSETLTQAGSPLQSEAGPLALRYLCPTA